MIVSFGDSATSALFNGTSSRQVRRYPPEILDGALRKLDLLNAATQLDDLRVPPGNRLELLQGDLSGFHSIRINAQWRIVFRWQSPNAYDVKIMDYH